MASEWKKHEKCWNPVIVMLLNNEWILEANKESGFGILRKMGNFLAGEAITAFSAFNDCENRFEQSWIEVIELPFINQEGLCEGKISVKDKSGWIKSYQFLVNLETGKRKIEKI